VARERASLAAPLAWLLIAAGAIYFAAVAGVFEGHTGKLAVLALGGALLVYVATKVDPAWILSASLVSTMFAGHWERFELGSGIVPHRILLAVGVLAVIVRANGRPRPAFRLGRVHFVLAAALAYAVISAIMVGTLDRRSARFVLLDDYGVLPFLMFLIAPVAFATARQRRILLGSLVAAGAYLSITAVFEKLKLRDLVIPHYINDPAVGTHFGRSRGPFAEAAANGLALYSCAVAAAIALTLWQGRWQRACAWAVLVLAPVGLLLTVTRSVWLAGIIATLVAMATTPGLRRWLLPGAVAGAAAVLIAFAVIPGLSKQASDREKDKNPVYERQNTTAAGLRMVADRPLFGVGWDRANDRIDSYFRLDPDIPLIGAQAGFHNLYLQYGVSLGLLGLAVWLLGGALAVREAFRGRAPPDVRPWQVGLKAIIVAWVIVGLTSPSSYIFSVFVVWTWAGVASVRTEAQRDGGATTWSRSQGKSRSTAFG
jgi:putative inorganic carbon (HCO3(-)) transporter